MSTLQRNSRRPKRRHDTEPPSRVLGRAAIVLACIGAFFYIASTLYSGIPLRDYRYVEATVPDPGSLIVHDPVRIQGVLVGQVAEVGAADGGGARLRLQLAGDTKLTADTKILVRANGLLGARYVELRTGTSKQELTDGATIRGDAASLTYGVTQALDVFDRETRGQLGALLGETATGLQGQGQTVNDALRVGGDVITPSADLVRYLGEFPDANARLLPSVAAAMRPLDANRVAIGELFGAAADAITPIPDRRDATRATLAAAPGALAAANSGVTRATGLVRAVRSLAREIRTTLPPAPAGLREASLLLNEAREPLRRANALLAAARPAVPGLLRITRSLKPLLDPANALALDLRSIVDTIGPYGCDIENLGVTMRSMTGFGSKAPGGPGGPPMQFRLQAVTPTGAENLSRADPTGLTKREGYAPPCKYLSEEYPIVGARPAAGGGR